MEVTKRMGFWDFLGKKKKTEQQQEATPTPQNGSSIVNYDRHRVYNPIVDSIWDGEKTPGELGEVDNPVPDYLRLRLRAYSMNLKTDLVGIITKKFFKWVIGKGLKLQAEPNKTVLGLSGISTDKLPDFQKNVEALFNLFAGSHYSDYQLKDSLHQKAAEAFEGAFLGGDVLCIIRFDKKYGPNIQIIDGEQVETPFNEAEKDKNNTIKNGIETNKKGEHVAFWVAQDNEDAIVSHKRVKARNSNGNLVAWMIYGTKARIDHYRGIPVISSILEKVAKLDRYVEASVTKAEQTANVVYAFKHSNESTGENILVQQLGSKKENGETEESIYEKSGRTANMLRQSTSGTVLNLVPDSELVSLSSPSETQFDAFFRSVFCALCAAVDIPEEVALQKYEQNYSSSRAAINGWEYIIEIYRHKFAEKFYKPFYRAWLDWQILNGIVPEDAFIKAKMDGNFMALEAYYNSRFIGRKMPHIDPLKEMKAIREMLGDKTTPLGDFSQAAEMMGLGDWEENIKKFEEQKKLIPKEDVKNENNGTGNTVEPKSKS